MGGVREVKEKNIKQYDVDKHLYTTNALIPVLFPQTYRYIVHNRSSFHSRYEPVKPGGKIGFRFVSAASLSLANLSYSYSCRLDREFDSCC
jgi:hypothetical protein